MKRIMITLFLVTFWINTYSQDTKGLVYIDNFDAYTAGEQLVTQNPSDWTTWNINPGSNEDLICIGFSRSKRLKLYRN